MNEQNYVHTVRNTILVNIYVTTRGRFEETS